VYQPRARALLAISADVVFAVARELREDPLWRNKGENLMRTVQMAAKRRIQFRQMPVRGWRSGLPRGRLSGKIAMD
jgi:hypothetical protein